MHYIYDDTFDGFLSCYYEHYFITPCEGIFKKEIYQMSLLNSFKEITTNQVLVDKMYEFIKTKLSTEIVINIYYCFQSDDLRKEELLLNYLNLGFEIGKDFDRYHTHDDVLPVLKLVSKVKRESHRYKGFVRFTDYKGTLYSEIHPTYNVLPIIGEHFADRFKSENFIIHDKNRNIAIVSHRGNVLCDFQEEVAQNLKEYDGYESLWRAYFNTMAIEERKSEKRQQRFVPLKYRKDLLEF